MQEKDSAKGQPGYAFFDLDFTLIPHDTLLLLCNYVLRRRRLRTFYFMVFAPLVPLAALKLVSSGLLKRFFLSFLKGMTHQELDELARDFVRDAVLPEIHQEVHERVKQEQASGRTVILTTASPSFYVKYIAEALGFEIFRATEIKVPERMPLVPGLTGKNNKGFAKLEHMADLLPEAEAALIRQGSMPEPMPNTIAFSDSTADLPMLRLSSAGVLVHPRSSDLKAEGQRRGWETMLPPRHYGPDRDRYWIMLRQAFGFYRRRD